MARIAFAFVSGKHCGNGSGGSRQNLKCSRIIIPYHPALLQLNRKLSAVLPDFKEREWAHLAPQIAWSLGGKNLAQLVQTSTRAKLSGMF